MAANQRMSLQWDQLASKVEAIEMSDDPWWPLRTVSQQMFDGSVGSCQGCQDLGGQPQVVLRVFLPLLNRSASTLETPLVLMMSNSDISEDTFATEILRVPSDSCSTMGDSAGDLRPPLLLTVVEWAGQICPLYMVVCDSSWHESPSNTLAVSTWATIEIQFQFKSLQQHLLKWNTLGLIHQAILLLSRQENPSKQHEKQCFLSTEQMQT